MPLADSPGLRISPLLHLSPQRAHLPHVPPESKRTSLLNTLPFYSTPQKYNPPAKQKKESRPYLE